MNKYALITGICGQDGSYLSRLLLEKGYNVYGLIRRSSNINTQRIEDIRNKLSLHYGDITDISCLTMLLLKIKKLLKDSECLEIYHLAAQSHVGISFELPHYTTASIVNGTLNLLESIRTTEMIGKVRMYNAATSELFGEVLETPQTEKTPFNPRSPYAVAKQYGFNICKNYRESYDMFVCSGILFNHESPQRGFNFVTRKITMEIGKIVRKESKVLELGNLDAKRDWSHAKDMVEAMYLMLQNDKPVDYVCGSGKQYSVRQFVELAFFFVGIEIVWDGKGLDEVGKNPLTDEVLVKINPKYYRPAEVETLLCDPTKIKKELNWKPKKSFEDLVLEMVNYDL